MSSTRRDFIKIESNGAIVIAIIGDFTGLIVRSFN